MDSEKINPYAAPAVIEAPSSGAVPSPEVTGRYGAYRNNRRLAAWLIGLLVFGTVFNIARGGMNLAYTLSDFGEDEERVTLVEGVMSGIGMVSIACMIVFGTWIVRSGKNAWLFAEVSRLRTRQDFQVQQSFLHDTPGWAVGWYFIPIASLWKPYAAMRDIVHASTLREGPPAFLLPTWWALWIFSMAGDNFVRVLNERDSQWSTGIEALTWTTMAGIEIALHLIAIVVVRTVTTLQTDTAAVLAEAKVSEPGPPGPA